MRKCKIAIKSPTASIRLVLDEEKGTCLVNNQRKEVNIVETLDQIERIISLWKEYENKDQRMVLDGVVLQLAFIDDKKCKKYKYDLEMPDNVIDLYNLVEGL